MIKLFCLGIFSVAIFYKIYTTIEKSIRYDGAIAQLKAIEHVNDINHKNILHLQTKEKKAQARINELITTPVKTEGLETCPENCILLE